MRDYRWFSTALNHEHGRYSDMQTWFMDWRSYQKSRNTLGKKIGLKDAFNAFYCILRYRYFD